MSTTAEQLADARAEVARFEAQLKAEQTASEVARGSIRDRELAESAPHLERARREGRAVRYIASDGCEVTVHPDGNEWFNAADWY
jgi:hypothetical protein